MKRFLSSTHNLRQTITSNTTITRQHMTPEIALRLITPECAIFHQDPRQNKVFDLDPFWGFYWPGGQSVSRYILDHPSSVSGKRILDVGSGSGACAIAAKLSGATTAIANDIDPAAKEVALINADLNGIQIGTSCENLIGSDCKEFDCLIIGDMFYDFEFADELMTWLIGMRKSHKTILIGDPGRHGLTENKYTEHLKCLIKYKLPDNVCIENNGFDHSFVWTFL